MIEKLQDLKKFLNFYKFNSLKFYFNAPILDEWKNLL